MMEAFLLLFYFLLFLFIINKASFFQVLPFRVLALIFTVKVICGLLVGYIYTVYYDGGDTFVFMDRARTFYSTLNYSWSLFAQLITGIEVDHEKISSFYANLGIHASPRYEQLFNNTLIFERIHAFLCLFTMGYYKVHVMLMSFASLFGLTALYKTVMKSCSVNSTIVLLSVYFIPSVMLWGSAMMKEPLILLFLGFTFYFFNEMLNNISLKYILFFLLSFVCLFVFKPFMLVMLPGFIAWLIYRKTKRKLLLTTFSLYGFFFILTVIAGKLNESWNVFQIMHKQQIIFMKFAVYYQAKSFIDLIPFAPDPLSMIRRFPEALGIALFRPYPFEGNGLLNHLAAVENLIIAAGLIVMIWDIDRKKLNTQPFSIVTIISGILILAITAFTTPVLGALVRLKLTGILLLITGAASCFGKKEKVAGL